MSSRAVQRTLRRTTAVAALLAAAGASASPAAAQTARDPDDVRPSRRYYSKPVPAEPSVEPEAVARAYRDALLRLAAGDRSAALDAVAALDPPPPGPTAAEAVHATEQGVAFVLHRVALHDYRALEPPILLHVDLFLRHRSARNTRLADHHVRVIRFAIGRYAETGGSPEVKATAAEVMAAIGLAQLEDRRRTAANATFERALDFHAGNGDALLGLAIDREWAGDYPRTVEWLERLVAVRPESAEARLRLALNLQRVGRQRDGARMLTALAADPDGGWASEIAYQELARHRIAAGDPRGAAALLREAIERFPASERLRLQLAFALDRAGDPTAARREVAELAKRPPNSAGDSPRRRYNLLPPAAAALELDALRRSAAGRLDALAAALEDAVPEGEGG